MSVIRLTLCPTDAVPRCHSTGAAFEGIVAGQSTQDTGPVVIMLHGFKYDPGLPHRCPQARIFGDHPRGWPGLLGLTGTQGTAITLGWGARGHPGDVFVRAGACGAALARVIAAVRRTAPTRPIHLIAHSMGAELALSGLSQAAQGSVARVIVLTGASLLRHAQEALRSPAGRTAELVNVTSRENDLFDFAFERLIGGGAQALGRGIAAPGAVNLQLDCPQTLAGLARLGCPVAPSRRAVCHWSSYTRPGAMAMYARMLHAPDTLSLPALRAALPATPAPRWSRLALPVKSRIMGGLQPETAPYERANRPLLLADTQRLESVHRP